MSPLPDPHYSIMIRELNTDQLLFGGTHVGLLVPLMHGIITDHARITDEGGRLAWRQSKLAYRDTGFPLPKSAFRIDGNVLPLAR
jgi:hypothetical protein